MPEGKTVKKKFFTNDSLGIEDEHVLEKQIKSVLGCPVTRKIVDEQKKIILDVGDLITYKAIEKAKQAKVLGILLDAVYR